MSGLCINCSVYAWMIVSNTLGHEQLTEHGVNMVSVWELIQDFSGGF